MKKLKIIAIILIATLMVSITGCSSNEVNDAGARNESRVISKELQSFIEQRENELKQLINVNTINDIIEQTGEFSLKAFPTLEDFPKTYFGIHSLGYASVPYLLELIKEHESMLVMYVIWYTLSVPPIGAIMPGEGLHPDDYSKDEDAYTPKWFARQLEEFAKTVPKKVNEICDSDIPLEEKYEQLNKLGLLAIPYLIDRIEAGEKEWEVCLAAQFLDRPVEERFELLSKLDFLEQEAREEYYSARTQNEIFEFDRYEAKSEYVSSLSSRQIAQVIEDNRVDMEILRKLME